MKSSRIKEHRVLYVILVALILYIGGANYSINASGISKSVKLKVDNKNIKFNIKQLKDRNIITYYEAGKLNQTVVYKNNNKVVFNNKTVATGNVVLNRQAITTKASSTKTLVKTLKGSINVGGKVAFASFILGLFSTSPMNWVIAVRIAAYVIANNIKTVYYTQYVYRSKKKDHRGNYKYSSTVKFYKDSARKKLIFTV